MILLSFINAVNAFNFVCLCLNGKVMLSRRSFINISALATISASYAVLASSCSFARDLANNNLIGNSGEPLRYTSFLYDTFVDVRAYTSVEVMDELSTLLVKFDLLFSKTASESDIFNINTAKGKPVVVNPYTADLINKSLEFCKRSNGIFDISVGAYTQLWDFSEGIIADKDQLSAASKHVDYKKIDVSDNQVTLLDPEMQLDICAVAKGYVLDQIIAFLLEKNCEGALISLGGNTYALGAKPDGSKWSIGIQNPGYQQGGLLATVDCSNQALVSSGIADRSFVEKGILYHHFLDTATGMPIDLSVAGVSVLGASAFECDAISTLCFMLNVEESLRFIEDYKNIEAMFYTLDNQIITSTKFNAKFK